MEGLQDKLDDEDEVYFRDLQRHERAARKIDDKIVEECKELLELFGIPFITSPGVRLNFSPDVFKNLNFFSMKMNF